MDPLLDEVRRYAEAHLDPAGFASTPVPGLVLIRAVAPSDLLYEISRPSLCLVLQGRKQVATGADRFAFGAGDSMLIVADVPTVSRITGASAAAPYFSLVLQLDPALLAELVAASPARVEDAGRPIHIEATDGEVADAALRLVRLLSRPHALQALQGALLRELHYWLLMGRHGAAIRRLGWPGGHVQRVARVVAVLREQYAQPLQVERLATVAGMSRSSFHQHFRRVTSLSPLQFQKQLRLIEARRLMLADGATASRAAFAVGYGSVPQFTREYGRMFGIPPMRDVGRTRRRGTAD